MEIIVKEIKSLGNDFIETMFNFVVKSNKRECPVFVDDGSIVMIFKTQAKAAEYFGIDEKGVGVNANNLTFTTHGKKFHKLLK